MSNDPTLFGNAITTALNKDEEIIIVRNTSGSTINAGSVVCYDLVTDDNFTSVILPYFRNLNCPAGILMDTLADDETGRCLKRGFYDTAYVYGSPLMAIGSKLEPVHAARYLASIGGAAWETQPFTKFRVWDNPAELLPAAAASDDLGYVVGTFGTDAHSIQGADVGGTNGTWYGLMQYEVPKGYNDGTPISIRVKALMIASGDGAQYVDFQIYRHAAPTVDICATAQQTLTGTEAQYTFEITPTDVVSGDVLNIRLKLHATDAGNAVPNITPKVTQIQIGFIGTSTHGFFAREAYSTSSESTKKVYVNL